MTNQDSFYNPSSIEDNDKRTFVPGMKRKIISTDGSQQDTPKPQPFKIELQSRPIAGILYSVSKDSYGELFPVYVGRNTIGNSDDADVYLSEESISSVHALILIRKISMADGSKKSTMTISDSGSKHGTFINDIPLDEDIVPISTSDLIRFGKTYRFQFIPLDPDVVGLFTSSDFKATPRKENRPIINNDFINYMQPPKAEEMFPSSVGEQDEQTFYGRSTKRKDDNSSNKTL